MKVYFTIWAGTMLLAPTAMGKFMLTASGIYLKRPVEFHIDGKGTLTKVRCTDAYNALIYEAPAEKMHINNRYLIQGQKFYLDEVNFHFPKGSVLSDWI